MNGNAVVVDEVMLEKAQVRNAGNSAAGSFDVEFYLSKDQNGSSDDVRLSRADGPGTRYSHLRH